MHVTNKGISANRLLSWCQAQTLLYNMLPDWCTYHPSHKVHLCQQLHTEHQALGLTLILALIWFGLGALAAALLPVLELIAAAAARTTAPTPASNPTEGPSPLAAA